MLFGFLELTGKTTIFLNRSQHTVDKTSKTTSDAPTAQADFSEGDNRQPNTNSDSNEGTLTDNQGSIGSIPSQNQWTISPNGSITVYTPNANASLASGSVLSGKSVIPKVSFRLIDNVSGVIAQGDIAVINGNFSGTFNFSTNASEGRLDIFNMREDGTEVNNVEIPVRFK